MPTRERRLNGLRKQAHTFNGVYFNRQNEKFKARVRLNGTYVCFGYHNTPEEAAQAVNNGLMNIVNQTSNWLNTNV